MPIRPIWIVVAALGMSAYLLFALVINAKASVAHGLGSLGLSGTLTVLGLVGLSYVLRFARWHWYLAVQGHSIPWTLAIQYYIAGFALTVTPGKAGEALRSLYLKRHGVSYSDSLAAFFAERLLDVLAVLLLAVMLLLKTEQAHLLWIAFAVVLVGFALVSTGSLSRLLTFAGRASGRFSRLCFRLSDLFTASRKLLTFPRLLAGLLYGLVAWGIEGYGLYIIAAAFQVSITPVESVGIHAASMLAGALAFFLPGGVGGTELVMTSLLVGGGATSSIAILVTLVFRLLTLWFAVGIGILTVLRLHQLVEHRLRTG